MCPIIGLQCSVIDLLNVSNHWTPIFCEWPVAVIQRCTIVYYFLFTELSWSRLEFSYFILQYFCYNIFSRRRLVLFSYSVFYLFMIYRCTFVFYMSMFFALFWCCAFVFFIFWYVYRCTFIFYLLIKYTLLYLLGSLTWLISMVRSIYKSIEKNLPHSRLNISWGIWTKRCTKYMERSRSSNIFKVISQRSRKKMVFDIFVSTVSLCPTCNPIPLETFKY
jgi:hypothetical protein